MTHEGVYVRVRATAQPSSRESIKDMIIDFSGITFEKNISINQDLTMIARGYKPRAFST